MYLFYCLLFSFVVSIITATEMVYDGPASISLWHSFSDVAEPNWLLRGEISVLNVASSQTQLKQQELDSESKELLRKLAAKDGVYRLKAIVKTYQGRDVEFFTFTKACSLTENRLADAIMITTDHEGSVIAITLSTSLPSCGITDDTYIPSEFSTSVTFKTVELGPSPDTATYLQKIEKEKQARERGDLKDNRSFLAKYWMYIVPVVIFMLVSGAGNQENGGGGAGR